ncbi:hypothetical protein [Profundibacterium mesophilum]|uniref:Uncharacterized protein n=1 Tax=Profundibacterium mesophilum KAUST100406-0324 TaxID=1037889 RepID=A0A921TE63_9RHOB|nr:hypothetical protein [Profundibacterium mesophilum]KAF0675089.1 hypothetical protein PMES_02610 [Profundibacterium mesophilum KAUST100406-0324]
MSLHEPRGIYASPEDTDYQACVSMWVAGLDRLMRDAEKGRSLPARRTYMPLENEYRSAFDAVANLRGEFLWLCENANVEDPAGLRRAFLDGKTFKSQRFGRES